MNAARGATPSRLAFARTIFQSAASATTPKSGGSESSLVRRLSDGRAGPSIKNHSAGALARCTRPPQADPNRCGTLRESGSGGEFEVPRDPLTTAFLFEAPGEDETNRR